MAESFYVKYVSDSDRSWTIFGLNIRVAIRASKSLLEPAFKTFIMESMPASWHNSDFLTLNKVTETDRATFVLEEEFFFAFC
jgi:hypothetical protein